MSLREATQLDHTLLSILRTEPTLQFDFYNHNGLPKSVFRLLSKLHNLEQVLAGERTSSVVIPSSTQGKAHHIQYQRMDDIVACFIDAYNVKSEQDDFKVEARLPLPRVSLATCPEDSSQADTASNLDPLTLDFLGLEVYRYHGQCIWALGCFISDKGKLIDNECRTIIMPDDDNTRTTPLKIIAEFIMGLPNIEYDPFPYSMGTPRYLSPLIEALPGAHIIHESEFRRWRERIVNYLVGTLTTEKVIRFKDLYPNGPNSTGYRQTSIELVAPENGRSKYVLNVHGDGSDGRAFRTPPRRFESHDEALYHLEAEGNERLSELYRHVGYMAPPFDTCQDPHRNEFTFATVVKHNDTPIAITSWESMFGANGDRLPRNTLHRYLQIFVGEIPFFLREDIHFDVGVHPRRFMTPLIEATKEMSAIDPESYTREAINRGVPYLIPKPAMLFSHPS